MEACFEDSDKELTGGSLLLAFARLWEGRGRFVVVGMVQK